MDREEHQQKVADYFNTLEIPIDINFRNLNEALYSVSELYIWPDDVDSVSDNQALLCWCIIEKIRKDGFPEELRM